MSKQQDLDGEIVELALLDVTVITEGTLLARLEMFRRVVATVGGSVDEVTLRPASKHYWQLGILARVPPQGQDGITDLANRAFGGPVKVVQYGTASELRQADQADEEATRCEA